MNTVFFNPSQFKRMVLANVAAVKQIHKKDSFFSLSFKLKDVSLNYLTSRKQATLASLSKSPSLCNFYLRKAPVPILFIILFILISRFILNHFGCLFLSCLYFFSERDPFLATYINATSRLAVSIYKSLWECINFLEDGYAYNFIFSIR